MSKALVAIVLCTVVLLTSGIVFETRHSPHFSQLRKLMIEGLVSH
jgi:hypothetical protein